MKRGNKPYSVTFESLVMRLVKQSSGRAGFQQEHFKHRTQWDGLRGFNLPKVMTFRAAMCSFQFMLSLLSKEKEPRKELMERINII